MVPESVDWRQWQFWFGVGQYAIGIFVAVSVWVMNRDKARAEDIKEVKAEIQAVDNRVTQVEGDQCSTDDLEKVYDRINDMSDKVSELIGTNKGIERTVDIIQEYLMQGGKR